MSTYAYMVRHRNGWGTGFGPKPTHCHECGAALPVTADTGATGYGCGGSELVAAHPDAPTLKQGETLERSTAICYACCHKHAVAQLLDRKPFGAYVSSDGKSITNWPGNVLGTIIRRSQIKLTRKSYMHGQYIHHYRVRDAHGALWWCRGNPGLCCTLHPMKG